jgi:hypothetical protein
MKFFKSPLGQIITGGVVAALGGILASLNGNVIPLIGLLLIVLGVISMWAAYWLR